MDKIFKQLYPGVKEEYLERAFEKLKRTVARQMKI